MLGDLLQSQRRIAGARKDEAKGWGDSHPCSLLLTIKNNVPRVYRRWRRKPDLVANKS
jgi:hypothetical protein